MGCGQSRTDIVYSVPCTSPEESKGESAIYRGVRARDGLISGFVDAPEVKTYQDIILRTIKLWGTKEFLGTRVKKSDGTLGDFEWKSYNQVLELATHLGSGIHHLDLAPVRKEYQNMELKFISIYAKNREEWAICDWASIMYGYTVLPIYDTLGPEAVDFVFDQTGVTTMFLSTDHLESIVKSKEAGKTNKLLHVVCFEAPKEELKVRAEKAGLKVHTYHDVLEAGKKNKVEYTKVTPETVFTFSYTSGTTGTPKAAMITHGNVVAIIGGCRENPSYKLYSTDVYLSYLPLAHVLERLAFTLMIQAGCAIGFYNGDVLKLKDDIKILRPTLFFSVPRLFNKFYDAMMAGINSLTGTKKKLAQKALSTKLENLRRTGAVTHSLYDRLVFKKTREAMGGRVRFMLTGSAPISSDVMDFLKVAICCPIFEGYGQTESCAASFLTYIGEPFAGHVGGPTYSVEFKTVDVPEMDYRSTDKDEAGNLIPRGEVCIRGKSVFPGYYKDPAKTEEAIDKDGWLHTGDIGRINPNGSLKIIDRKKNIFKLAIGEYIAPEKIENIYVTCPSVAEVFVYGDSLQHFLVGIIFPDKNNVEKFAAELGISGTFQELVKNPKIIEKVLKEITARGVESKLHSFEQVKKLYLESSSFGERDLLTPAFKVKRHEAKKYYQTQIDEMYKEGLPERK
eukprot:CAMPEP_0176461624 /NCGR_PEP_ID=MMETSP0127-20121128/34775_1 /TAXON_ID=938130 /ORGANISM="Platyophrya macrostoma, Strain WH" /LENGTH=678 /DNA_ID=CAMNT_0017853371 /DNA_START=23 /DNA_END=2059 /DNA_ORIENTATION=+